MIDFELDNLGSIPSPATVLSHTWEGNHYFEVTLCAELHGDVNSKETKRDVCRRILSRTEGWGSSDEELDKVKLKYHGVFPYYPMTGTEIKENKERQIIMIKSELKKLNIPCWKL